ncbi:flavodoxin [Neptuniibacter sp. QD34_54]|uniref:flavodoxin n=1 Tax=Neptuniibacter sp. QD34_54 TaxID=3398208 RepID=UPI0039F51DCE
MAVIKVVVGSVYGNALDVAEMCSQKLTELKHSVELLRNPEFAQVVIPETEVILICTSTTGQGEIPHNLLSFYDQLHDQLPQIPTVKYGVIALGDSSYDTFAEAGYLMDSLMQQLQAQRVGNNLVIDACETMAPLEEAEPWLLEWVKGL